MADSVGIEIHHEPPPVLPAPCEIIHRDYRPDEAHQQQQGEDKRFVIGDDEEDEEVEEYRRKKNEEPALHLAGERKTLEEDISLDTTHLTEVEIDEGVTIMSWDLDGFKHAHIGFLLKEIRNANPDIIFLQEADAYCARSGYADLPRVLAEELRMNSYFVCEFQEKHSPIRSNSSQGGGVSGHAILSKYDISDVSCYKYDTQPVDWNMHGEEYKMPRAGFRVALLATIHSPIGAITCANVNLEMYCGISHRIDQLVEVVGKFSPHVIMGNFSAIGHGLSRLSPYLCNDWLRFASLGSSESDYHEEMLWGDAEINPGYIDIIPSSVVTYSSLVGWIEGKADHVRVKGLVPSRPRVGTFISDTFSGHTWISVCLRKEGDDVHDTSLALDPPLSSAQQSRLTGSQPSHPQLPGPSSSSASLFHTNQSAARRPQMVENGEEGESWDAFWRSNCKTS